MQENFEKYAEEVQNGLGWEPPIPFSEISVPDFPLDCLPAAVGNFARQLSVFTQTPPEMAGLQSLGVLSTLFQSRYTVEVRPGWSEPLCLYVLAVARPGERKSAVFSPLLAPIREYEAQRRELEREEVEINRSEKRRLEGKLSFAEKAAAKSKEEETNADLYARELAGFQEKFPFRMLVDDSTPEKLADMLEQQGGNLTLASPEGGLFDTIGGRYDSKINLDVYLKSHDGESLTVDRIGRRPNFIKSPHLTVILAAQPEVVLQLMGNPAFRGRGLCGRFLYAFCESRLGYRQINPPQIDPEVQKRYFDFVSLSLEDQAGGIVRLSAEAQEVLNSCAQVIEERLRDRWEFMADWSGKLAGTAVRIAALLHLSESPHWEPISGETMARAFRIAEVLGCHAEKVYSLAGVDKTEAAAKRILKKLQAAGKEKISKHSLLLLFRNSIKAEEMEQPLKRLEDRNYIRRVRESTGGRPAEWIYINPATSEL